MVEDDITLLICDDHRILTDALAAIVAATSGIELVEPPVHDAEAAVRACSTHHPDVVLMDIDLSGGLDGIEATRRIKVICPRTKVIILSGHRGRHTLARAVEAGASGFLDKSQAAADVLGVVRAAAAGEVLIDDHLLPRLVADLQAERAQRRDVHDALARLTAREGEVLKLLTQGKRNEAIAQEFSISPQTVQTHVNRILKKLAVHSKLEAVARAALEGDL